jgi:hypothetical protein
VITTAGTLVTLLFGLVAVITGQEHFTLPHKSHGWLGASVILFVLACFCALLVSVPMPYSQTQVTAENLLAWWGQDAEFALLATSSAKLKALAAARRMNGAKAFVLVLATLLLIAALATLCVATLKIL